MPRTPLHGVLVDILAGFGAGGTSADVLKRLSQQVGGAAISWLGSLFLFGLGSEAGFVPIPT